MEPIEILRENYAEISDKIDQSCTNSNRKREDVRLIWVSKRKGIEMVHAAAELGAIDFGENRIQEAIEKFSEPIPNASLHIIGPIQKNKMRKAVAVAEWIHTLSSLEDLDRLNRICEEEGKIMKVLFQINTSEETTKCGIHHQDAESFLKSIPVHPNLLYCGLMTIGKNTGNPEDSREEFQFLTRLRNTFKNSDERFTHFTELSMGMTQDMDIAIAEGATMIRIGTALFGTRD